MRFREFQTQGAGCLLVAQDTGRWCLQQRSDSVSDPGVWSTWGGGREPGESLEQTVRRELAEEAGYHGPLTLYPLSENRQYVTFVGVVPQEFEPRPCSEWKDYCWVDQGQWPQPLHHKLMPALNLITSQVVEVVTEGSEHKYLWHGSRQPIKMLEPRQAVDTGGAVGSNQNAIYATSDPRVAIAMGLTTPDSDTAMFPNDPQMVLFKGKIRKGENVYLHKLPFYGPDGKPQFVKGANDREFYSIPDLKGIKPVEIKTVPVDKYLNLIRQATPHDLELQKQFSQTQDVAEGFDGAREYHGIIMSIIEGDDGFKLTATSPDGKKLGFVEFSYDTNGTIRAEELEVYEKFRGQGIAKTMYDYVKEQGFTIARSSEQTPDGAAFWDKNKPGKNIWEQGVAENFADGRNPGRRGLARRVGVNCKQSVTKLRSIAKKSSGERQRMAHWCANMKSGKKK